MKTNKINREKDMFLRLMRMIKELAFQQATREFSGTAWFNEFIKEVYKWEKDYEKAIK